jgi:hypothetical protein
VATSLSLVSGQLYLVSGRWGTAYDSYIGLIISLVAIKLPRNLHFKGKDLQDFGVYVLAGHY